MSLESSPRLYTTEFLKVTVIMFLIMTTMTMFLLLPLLIEKMGGDAADIGLVMGITPLGAVISRIFWGRWMDLAGRKKILLLGTLLNTAAILLFLTVRGVGILMVMLRLLQGLALGGNITAVWTIIADITPQRRLAESLGIFGIAGMAALALGPWGGELVMKAHGFPGLFIASGLLSLTAVLLSLRVRESRPSSACDSITPSYRKMLKGGVMSVFLVTIAFAVSRSAFASFFAEYSRLRQIGSMGVYSIIYSGTTIGFRLLAGRLPDRLGRTRVLIPALIVFGTGIGLIAFIHSWPLFILSAFFCGLGHCFLYPVLNALVIQKVHSCTRGTATGLFINSFDLGIGAGSIAWGLAAQFGGYRLMYLLGGATALLGIGGVRRLLREASPAG
ncbi:MAG: MFS transporter [PVC group bacterium]